MTYVIIHSVNKYIFSIKNYFDNIYNNNRLYSNYINKYNKSLIYVIDLNKYTIKFEF